MQDLLSQLFNGTYVPTMPKGKAQDEAEERLAEMYDKIGRGLGQDFETSFFSASAAEEERSNYFYYCAGFRLGAKLILEAIQPLTASKP